MDSQAVMKDNDIKSGMEWKTQENANGFGSRLKTQLLLFYSRNAHHRAPKNEILPNNMDS